MVRLLLILCLALLGVLPACVTGQPAATYGVQPDSLGYVPAAIAILPCRPWPPGARFLELPLSSAKDQEIEALCAGLDAFVVKGFTDQPYMRGYSPKAVLRDLEKAGKSALLQSLSDTWRHNETSCLDCPSAPAYYQASLARRPEWQAWLTQLSESVRNVDAVLLPFVTFAYDKRYEDRGVDVAERAAGVTLLLVDTGRGQLIWAGGREASAPAKRLGRAGQAEALASPPWSQVTERLFTEDVWRDFPGRQIY
jgi:hypothetical protein